jgi:HEAT repeat protein
MKTDHLIQLLLASLLALAAMDVRAAEEPELIATLQSAASAPEKCAACQKLRVIGTARSVPALAALLGDERISQAARYALEPMSCPEAGAALREAMGKTSGPVKAGLVDSLGWRREPETVPLLAPLLGDADTNIAAAAATALGRIGGKDALAALVAVRDTAPPALRPAVLEGLLKCAERAPSAAAIYRGLYESKAPEHVRTAAYRGRLLSDARKRADLMRKALTGKDRAATRAALQVLRELDDARTLDTCAMLMASLPPEAQIAVVDALAKRGRPALSAFSAAMKSRQPAVRIAALQALAEMNDLSAVPLLAAAAARGDKAEREAAVDALARLHGPGAREALLAHLRKAEPAAKAELLRALGERGEPEAAVAVLSFVGKEKGAVRAAALQALAKLAAADTLAPLLELASGAKVEADRATIVQTVIAICANCRDKEKCAGPVIAAMNRGDAAQKLALIPALSRLGTSQALAAARAATEDANAGLATEAIRVLSQWPTVDAAPPLLDLARARSDERQHALALRGCIGLAQLEADDGKRLALLRQALAAAKRPEEMRQALGEIGKIPTREALQAAQTLANDPVLGKEAATAVAQIRQQIEPSAPKPAGGGPFIQDWQVCGPYSQPGVTGALKVFDVAFAPEKPGASIEWKPVPKGDRVNLAGLFPGKTDCAAYLKTEIVSPQDCDGTLLLGSDDGVKAWLNGAVVHSKNADRFLVADQDRAPIKLKKGKNVLMLKVTQGGGGWMACARIARAGAAAHATPAAGPPPKPSVLPKRDTFKKLRLSGEFYAEGAHYGDFNRDGKLDVVAGPFWFEGPEFQKRHEYRPAKAFDPKSYSDNFLTFAGDFNGDGWTDILCAPFPGKEAFWYENPAGKDAPWKQHLAYPFVGNESPVWGDINGDGRPELIFCNDGFLGYATPNPARPDEPWVFHAISKQDKRYFRFTHGIGFGDINGDSRVDAVEAAGWWEQPAQETPGQPWTFHPQQFAAAGAQMLVTDVDGDGLADVITAWHCHLYGMVWWKQIRASDGAINWQQHVILQPTPDLNSTAFRVSQMHALELVDMNGDGLKDILTGKRFWAHGPTGDKEPDAPAVVFWLELRRDGKGGATFVPHLIDDDSGVGTQVAATDLNGDGRPDVIVGNKKGIFIHLSQPAQSR